jgi:amino-acid N-acetyltransferase
VFHRESNAVPAVELRPAKSSDREDVEELLAENDLPTADLDSAYSSLFVCESAAGERVGVGGLEVGGEGERQIKHDAGLLRSVAVEESVRGAGYGTAICKALLDRAREGNLDAVFLLTTTAEEFFADLGFERVQRSRVPDSIRASAEFSDLCPASATCMKRDLP